MIILVTNNPLVNEQYQRKYRIEFLDTDLLGVLTHIRDRIHKGCKLLTHPLSGSVKPNESPYKSVLISDNPEDNWQQSEICLQSVSIIEEAFQAVRKFSKKSIPEQHLNDLRIVDLSLIRSALEK